MAPLTSTSTSDGRSMRNEDLPVARMFSPGLSLRGDFSTVTPSMSGARWIAGAVDVRIAGLDADLLVRRDRRRGASAAA